MISNGTVAFNMRSPALFDFYEPQLGVALLIMHSMKLRLIYCIVNFKVGMQTSIISLYVAHKHACTHLEREIRLSRLPPLSGGNSPPPLASGYPSFGRLSSETLPGKNSGY